MIDVLYRSGFFSYTTKVLEYTAGMVATFSGNREVTICSDKAVPIGFFSDTQPNSIPFDNSGAFFSGSSTPILVGVGEYRTDIFEESTYKINDFLYCSCNGKITNEARYRGNIIIGTVNYVSDKPTGKPDDEIPLIGFVSCFAKGLEFPIAKKKESFSRYRILKNENKKR
jgi:hypothetical protein